MYTSNDKYRMTVSIFVFIPLAMFNGILAEETNFCGFPGIPFGGRINSELAEWAMGKRQYLQCSQFKYEAGENVEYDCFGPGRKYRFEGNNQLFCNENGKWNGDLPQCVENVAYKRGAYLSPDIPVNLLTDGLKTDCLNVSGNSGSFVQLRLGHPYQIKEVDIYFRDDIADISGEDLKIQNSGTSIKCHRNTSPLSSNHIRFSCRASETDFVSETIVQFSHSTLSDLCVYEIEAYIDPKTQDCGYPEIPANGKVLDAFRSKSVTYQCLDGFQLVGRSTITCNKGKWSAPAPLCMPSSIGEEKNSLSFSHINDGFQADDPVVKDANLNHRVENSVSNEMNIEEKEKGIKGFDNRISSALENRIEAKELKFGKEISLVLEDVEAEVEKLESAANNLWLVALLSVLIVGFVISCIVIFLFLVRKDLGKKILMKMRIKREKSQKAHTDPEKQRMNGASD